jgi:hypothetical protein
VGARVAVRWYSVRGCQDRLQSDAESDHIAIGVPIFYADADSEPVANPVEQPDAIVVDYVYDFTDTVSISEPNSVAVDDAKPVRLTYGHDDRKPNIDAIAVADANRFTVSYAINDIDPVAVADSLGNRVGVADAVA